MSEAQLSSVALCLFIAIQSLALIPVPGALESLRSQELPNFGKQQKALGYLSTETFKVEPQLKSRVEFWKKIYTEISISQAIIHDSKYPEVTYQILDISNYTDNSRVPYGKRMAAMNRFFKSEKEKIAKRLQTLQSYEGNPSELPVELRAIHKKFELIPGRNKYSEAMNRLRAQVGQREYVAKGFVYGGKYFREMMSIFEKHKIPKELTRLPLVESAFNPDAKSKVGASGIWQFMRGTGQKYLKINRAIDERNDPIAATKAAAQLLRENYEALGSWPLAITAYNHGRYGVARAVASTGSSSLAHIIKNYKAPSFGFASQNFFAEFLAILEIEKDHKKFFGKMLVEPPLEHEKVILLKSAPISEIAQRCQLSQQDISDYNPALTDWVTTGRTKVPQNFVLKIPVGSKELCARSKKSLTQNKKTSPAQDVSFQLN